MRLTVAILLAVTRAAGAQTFEVATLKPNISGDGSTHSQTSKGSVTATNFTVGDYLLWAFEIRTYQLDAPKWCGSDRYDLNARIPEGAAPSAIPAMLRALLIERFAIEFRREPREMPVLALVEGKGGAKLPASSAPHQGISSGMTMFRSKGHSLAPLAAHLSNVLGRPVLDMTGLTGAFDVDLKWSPENAQGEFAAGPSLTTALAEQLGLKLEGRRAPVEVLVIDRARRAPANN